MFRMNFTVITSAICPAFRLNKTRTRLLSTALNGWLARQTACWPAFTCFRVKATLAGFYTIGVNGGKEKARSRFRHCARTSKYSPHRHPRFAKRAVVSESRHLVIFHFSRFRTTPPPLLSIPTRDTSATPMPAYSLTYRLNRLCPGFPMTPHEAACPHSLTGS